MRIFINLMKKRQEGTFSEIFDDWKWILSYSKRYKGAILYDTIIGIAGTLLGILSAIASKYLIDIITGYDAQPFWSAFNHHDHFIRAEPFVFQSSDPDLCQNQPAYLSGYPIGHL